MNYSPIEVKVREATNGEEPWGPHGSLMAEIAKVSTAGECGLTCFLQSTFSYEEFPEAMGMLWRRMLKEKDGKFWRRIYKVSVPH